MEPGLDSEMSIHSSEQKLLCAQCLNDDDWFECKKVEHSQYCCICVCNAVRAIKS